MRSGRPTRSVPEPCRRHPPDGSGRRAAAVALVVAALLAVPYPVHAATNGTPVQEERTTVPSVASGSARQVRAAAPVPPVDPAPGPGSTPPPGPAGPPGTGPPPPPAAGAVAPPGAGVPAPGAGYAWPLLPAPEVRTPFRAPAHAYAPGHRGVDLAGTPGQVVLAARAGTVVFAGPVAGRPLVSVQHDDGLRTTYEPVTPAVRAGDVMVAGAVLGTLEPGHTGCDTCLHWGVRRDRTEYLDPLVLLRPARVRLLPVPDPWPG